jgi:hypothetical protein
MAKLIWDYEQLKEDLINRLGEELAGNKDLVEGFKKNLPNNKEDISDLEKYSDLLKLLLINVNKY